MGRILSRGEESSSRIERMGPGALTVWAIAMTRSSIFHSRPMTALLLLRPLILFSARTVMSHVPRGSHTFSRSRAASRMATRAATDALVREKRHFFFYPSRRYFFTPPIVASNWPTAILGPRSYSRIRFDEFDSCEKSRHITFSRANRLRGKRKYYGRPGRVVVVALVVRVSTFERSFYDSARVRRVRSSKNATLARASRARVSSAINCAAVR